MGRIWYAAFLHSSFQWRLNSGMENSSEFVEVFFPQSFKPTNHVRPFNKRGKIMILFMNDGSLKCKLSESILRLQFRKMTYLQGMNIHSKLLFTWYQELVAITIFWKIHLSGFYTSRGCFKVIKETTSLFLRQHFHYISLVFSVDATLLYTERNLLNFKRANLQSIFSLNVFFKQSLVRIRIYLLIWNWMCLSDWSYWQYDLTSKKTNLG